MALAFDRRYTATPTAAIARRSISLRSISSVSDGGDFLICGFSSSSNKPKVPALDSGASTGACACTIVHGTDPRFHAQCSRLPGMRVGLTERAPGWASSRNAGVRAEAQEGYRRVFAALAYRVAPRNLKKTGFLAVGTPKLSAGFANDSDHELQTWITAAWDSRRTE